MLSESMFEKQVLCRFNHLQGTTRTDSGGPASISVHLSPVSIPDPHRRPTTSGGRIRKKKGGSYSVPEEGKQNMGNGRK